MGRQGDAAIGRGGDTFVSFAILSLLQSYALLVGGYPGFRRASTPTPPSLSPGHTLRYERPQSQSGAP
jgi:hypothetical protein